MSRIFGSSPFRVPRPIPAASQHGFPAEGSGGRSGSVSGGSVDEVSLNQAEAARAALVAKLPPLTAADLRQGRYTQLHKVVTQSCRSPREMHDLVLGLLESKEEYPPEYHKEAVPRNMAFPPLINYLMGYLELKDIDENDPEQMAAVDDTVALLLEDFNRQNAQGRSSIEPNDLFRFCDHPVAINALVKAGVN